MKIEIVPINKIKINPDNPRTIKDDAFKKLTQSIKDFPEMLRIRPIVVNKDMIVLGGNMRLKACVEAGLKEVAIINASSLSEEQQREFLIKDNISGGEWNWEVLQSDWDTSQLSDWGLDVPTWNDANNMTDDSVDITEDFDPIGNSEGKQRIVIIFDGKDEAESWVKSQPSLIEKMKKFNNAWQIDLSTQYT